MLPHGFLTWTTTLGRIFTVDNLRKWCFTLVNWCCLSKKNEEIVNHLLLHFVSTTSDLWPLVLNLFGVV